MESDGNTSGFPRRWRVSAAARVFIAVAIVGFACAALFVALDSYRAPGDGAYDHYYAALVLALVGFSLWRGSFYPYIEADVSGLTLRNPIRTRRIAWSEIRDVSPGYYGLVFQLVNERSVTGWAVQETNIAAWLRRPTRSKRIAKEITDLAGAPNGPGRPRPA